MEDSFGYFDIEQSFEPRPHQALRIWYPMGELFNTRDEAEVGLYEHCLSVIDYEKKLKRRQSEATYY